MKERFIHPFIAILLLAGSVGQTDAQLLFRQGEPYTNYAFEGYRAYESLIFGRTRSPHTWTRRASLLAAAGLRRSGGRHMPTATGTTRECGRTACHR